MGVGHECHTVSHTQPILHIIFFSQPTLYIIFPRVLVLPFLPRVLINGRLKSLDYGYNINHMGYIALQYMLYVKV